MWLLESNAFQIISQGIASAGITAEQIVQFEAQASLSIPARVVGGEGIIPIEGVLTEKPNFYARYIGGGNALYKDIAAAVLAFDQDPTVKTIVLDVGNSPGGTIAGLFSTIEAIRGVKKPVIARVQSMAASATYALVSAANSIEASDISTMVGSIGVVQNFHVDDHDVVVGSTKAPKKNPDAGTPEGQSVIREVLDEVHALFAGAIAKGRGTTVSKVNSDFGEGAIVLAKDAIKKGMIDRVGTRVGRTEKAVVAVSDSMEVEAMNFEILRREHPDVFTEVVNSGVAQERDRVLAHITMGTASGDMETAVKAITEGSKLSASLQATYLAAGMRRSEITARGSENPDVLIPATGDGSGGGEDSETIVANKVAEMMGYDPDMEA